MPSLQDQALVLRRWDFSETSQTVALFTRQHGLLRGLAKGAKRERGKFCGGFEPVTRGQILALRKPSAELATLTEWDLQEVFPGPRRDLHAHRWALCGADLVSRIMERDDPHPLLYDALLEFWRQIGNREDPRDVLRFLLVLLDDTGHMPHLETVHDVPEVPTLGFHPAEGRFTADPGPQGSQAQIWRIRRATAMFLAAIRVDAQAAGSTDEFERATRFLLSCICWTLGSEPASVQSVWNHTPEIG